MSEMDVRDEWIYSSLLYSSYDKIIRQDFVKSVVFRITW